MTTPVSGGAHKLRRPAPEPVQEGIKYAKVPTRHFVPHVCLRSHIGSRSVWWQRRRRRLCIERSATTRAAGGKTGGTISTAYTSFPDFLDPALSYTQEGWQSLWTVYTGLLTYNHAEGAEGATVVPGLAEAMPDISADGKTYKLKLRSGLKYSDGKAVKASDFEHSIKRMLNLESGGSSFFLGIVGAEKYVKDGKAKADIPGIVTDDATGDVTITLAKPDGRFPYILTMPFASIVPGDTPFENQTKNPPAGVGPYKFENVRINRGYDLVKVPTFNVPDQQVGKLDKIEVSVIKDRRRQTQDTIQNKIDYMNDPPAPDQLRDVRAEYTGKRYEEFVTNSTYYLFMNEQLAPFDNPEVRKAVNFAIDKRSLARLFGGLLEPGCNFLPPGMKGYEKIDPCPYGDPNAAPDVAKAKQMIKDAGAAGKSVTVYGNDEPELRSIAEYYSDVLNEIGLKSKPRIIEALGLLHEHRQPEHEGPGRRRELVPGLPAPGQLHVPRGRQVDPADQQPELRQRRRLRRSTRSSRKPTRTRTSTRSPMTTRRPTSWSSTTRTGPCTAIAS